MHTYTESPTTGFSLPPTTTRVERCTSDEINQRIEADTRSRIYRAAESGNEGITRRLAELEREWDIERVLEANASSVTLATLALGAFVNRKWFAFPAVVAGFLLQHALQGWCPPVPILRRMGVRTAREIEIERTALRILRGDFESAPKDPTNAMQMAHH